MALSKKKLMKIKSQILRCHNDSQDGITQSWSGNADVGDK